MRFSLNYTIMCALLLGIAAGPVAAQQRPASPATGPELAQAQVMPAPQGVYAVVSNESLSPDRPAANGLVGVRVLRAAAGSTNFKEVGRVQRAASLGEFQQQTGNALDAIRQQQKLPTDEAAWAWVQAHPRLQEYGLLPLSLDFRVAMGTAALDVEAASAPAGTRYTYQLQPIYASGQPARPAAAAREFTVVVGQRSPLGRPRLARAVGRDSAVSLRWQAPQPAGAATDPTRLTLYGRVWRRGPGEATFRVVAPQVLANRTSRGDSVRFAYREAVPAEALFRYYIEPLDFVGNPGPASDTATVLSVNPNGLPALNSLVARDTAGGIVLRWPALPPKAYVLGVEIQRSRDARGNYVRLDTVAASAARYFDTQLLPDVVYHYRLRPLLRGGLVSPAPASGAAFASHSSGTGRTAPPLAPVQFTAEPEGTGVRLRWQPAAPNLSLGGYYVYRGTSRRDSLLVVSPFLTAGQLTFLDTTARNGRREYVYAVRAVDKSLQPGALSEIATARPNRPMTVSAPLGLAGFADGPVLRLRWEDAQRRDDNVVAYRLYRRPAPVAGTAALTGRSGYQVLAEQLPSAAYDDRAAPAAAGYQYAVAALDGLGTESPLSAPLTLARAASPGPQPPGQVNARAVANGIEVSWSQPATAPGRGYALYRRTREQATPQRLATVPAQTRYVDQTAKPGTLYIYSLAAVGAAQESARSSEISVRR